MKLTKKEFRKADDASKIAHLKEVLKTNGYEIYGKIKYVLNEKENGHMYIIPYDSQANRVSLWEDEERNLWVKISDDQSSRLKRGMYIKAQYKLNKKRKDIFIKNLSIEIDGDSIVEYPDYVTFMHEMEATYVKSMNKKGYFDENAFVVPDGKIKINEWACKIIENAVKEAKDNALQELEEERKKLEEEIVKRSNYKDELEKKIANLEIVRNKKVNAMNIADKNRNTALDELKQIQQLIITECIIAEHTIEENVQKYRSMGITFPYYELSKQNLIKEEEEKIPIRQLVDDVWEYLWKQKDLRYDISVIKRFLFSLHTNQIILLFGKPGTGKTTLPNAVAEAIGAKCVVIPVQPNWTDNQDLLGFYNVVDERYMPTVFMDTLVEARENPNKLYLIVLDEMNLAHVEYYFSEILSAISSKVLRNVSSEDSGIISSEEVSVLHLYSDRKMKKIDALFEKAKNDIEMLEKWEQKYGEIRDNMSIYPPDFEIPENVRFIGTLNKDATTKDLSPKVIDRSYMIEVEDWLDAWSNTDQQTQSRCRQLMDSNNELKSSHDIKANYFKPIKLKHSDFEDKHLLYHQILDLKPFLNDCGYHISERFEKYIEELLAVEYIDYLKNGLALSDILIDELELELDEIILDKVITNIEVNEKNASNIKVMMEELKKYNCARCIKKLEEMLQQIEENTTGIYFS